MADSLLLQIEVIAVGVIFVYVYYVGLFMRGSLLLAHAKNWVSTSWSQFFGVITAPDPTQLNSTGRRISEHVQNSATGQKLRFVRQFQSS